MNSILEVSKEGITIHQIPLIDRVSTGSDLWKKIPDLSISRIETNIQFRLIDGKNLMVYLLDPISKISIRGKEHLGPKTVLVPHNEKVVLETGHSLKLSLDLSEDKKVFNTATVIEADPPGLKIEGVPVHFDDNDDAVEIVGSKSVEIEKEDFAEQIDEIEIDKALNDKVELNKLYYDDEDIDEAEIPEDFPTSPPPVDEIKSDEEREQDAIESIMEVSNEESSDTDYEDIEIDISEDEDIEDDLEEDVSGSVFNAEDILLDDELDDLAELDDSEDVTSIEEDIEYEEGKVDIEAMQMAREFDDEQDEVLDNLAIEADIDPHGITGESELPDLSMSDEQEEEEESHLEINISFDDPVAIVQEEEEEIAPLSSEDAAIEIGTDAFKDELGVSMNALVKETKKVTEDENFNDSLDLVDENYDVENEVSLMDYQIPDEIKENTQNEFESQIEVEEVFEDNSEDEEDEIQFAGDEEIDPEEEASISVDLSDGNHSRSVFVEIEGSEEESDEDEEEDDKPFNFQEMTKASNKDEDQTDNDDDEDDEDDEESEEHAPEEQKSNLINKVKSFFNKKNQISELNEEEDDDEDYEEDSASFVLEGNKDDQVLDQSEIVGIERFDVDKPKTKIIDRLSGLFSKNDKTTEGDEDIDDEHEDDATPDKTKSALFQKLTNIFKNDDATDDHEDDSEEDEEEDDEQQEMKPFSYNKSKTFNFSKITNILKRKKSNDIEDSEEEGDIEEDEDDMEEFEEFPVTSEDDVEEELTQIGLRRLTFLDKVKNFFKRKPVSEEDQEREEAQSEADNIAESLEKNFGKDAVEEVDDTEKDTARNIHKNKSSLVAKARKNKRKQAPDPRPGVPARVISIVLTAFIIFNLNFHLFQNKKIEKQYKKYVDKHFVQLKAPMKKGARKLSAILPKTLPKEVKKPLYKILSVKNIDILFKGKNHRYLSLYLIFELLSLIILGNSLILYLFGARTEHNFLGTRFKAILRFCLWPITLLMPILDLPVLLGRRSFRETITKSYVLYPNTSIRNLMLTVIIPCALIGFFIWPYFSNLEAIGSNEIKQAKFKRTSIDNMQFSNVLNVSLQPTLRPGFTFIPSWIIGKRKKMQASLKIYSIRTDQEAFMKRHKSINFIKILNTVAGKDPLFYHFHPSLKVFKKSSRVKPGQKEINALHKFLIDSLSFSILSFDAIKSLYQSGPYVLDNLLFKKLFLKQIDSTGLKRLIVHRSKDEITLEIIPTKQSSVQTSYFMALKGKDNTLYSLTYSKKASDTRKEITQLSLNKMNFNEKAATEAEDPSLQALGHLKNVINPSYKEEESFNALFEYYYTLGKQAIDSNQKPFIDLAKEEVYKTGDLIGKVKQDPKLSQKYREKFRNLSKALETLDSRYFSM